MRRRPANARLSLLAAGLFALTSASAAWGFVRKKTDGGVDEYWQVSCVPLTVYINGFSGMSSEEIGKSIAAAAHTWSPSEVTCADGSHPFLEIVPSMASAEAVAPAPGYDGRNTLFFYSPYRPYPDNSGISFSVIALTSTWARADGHIVDADVRVNAADHTFVNADTGFVPPDDGQERYDLQNALTHEFGHLIGLGHSCWNLFSDLEPPIDDQDLQVPSCDMAPIDIQQTVMFATIRLDQTIEISKRILSPDDIRAVCSIYPASQDPQSCTYDMPDDGCGCSAAGAHSLPVIVLVAVVAVVLVRRRTRTG